MIYNDAYRYILAGRYIFKKSLRNSMSDRVNITDSKVEDLTTDKLSPGDREGKPHPVWLELFNFKCNVCERNLQWTDSVEWKKIRLEIMTCPMCNKSIFIAHGSWLQ